MSAISAKLNGGPLALIDEGFHLVRRLPLGILMLHYVGSVPFVVAFLFFWADMSHGPLAAQRVAEAALGLAVAYLWMKFWQVAFCRRVREWITGEEKWRWTLRRVWRVVVLQTFLQPLGLILKPLSLVVPFLFLAPVLAFFSVVTVEGTRHDRVSMLCGKAFSQSLDNAREVYQIVLVLFLFGLFVLINFGALIVVVPWLLQVLFAIDTEFMRAGWSAGNSTFFISALALTYLALDPLLKAIFTLRSYYLDARATGEDLRVDLHRVRRRAPSRGTAATVALIVGCTIGTLLFPNPAPAADSGAEAEREETGISSEELDERIDQVLSQREYAWRLPQPPVEEEGESGIFRRFVNAVGEHIKEIWKGVGRIVGDFLEWLLRMFFGGDSSPAPQSSPRNWTQGLQVLIIGLGAVLLGLTCLILWQAWQKRSRIAAPEVKQAINAKPDLEDDDVTADELPVDEWTRMAEAYKTRGDFRLALRAYYLASLAALADENLVVVAKAKSNREYQQELFRRAHDQPERVEAFRSNCDLYEEAWYGMYSVDNDKLTRFERNHERIKRNETVVAS